MIHATSIMTVSVSRSNVARWIYCACRPSFIVQHGIHHGTAMLLMWNVRCCCLCHFIQIRSSQVMCVLCVYPHQSSSKSISHVKVAFKPMLSEHSCSLLLLNLPYESSPHLFSSLRFERNPFLSLPLLLRARAREARCCARAGGRTEGHTHRRSDEEEHPCQRHPLAALGSRRQTSRSRRPLNLRKRSMNTVPSKLKMRQTQLLREPWRLSCQRPLRSCNEP